MFREKKSKIDLKFSSNIVYYVVLQKKLFIVPSPTSMYREKKLKFDQN